MKIYKTYIFDMDGTITDTLVVWLDLLRDCLLAFDVTPPDDKTLSQHTHDWRDMLKLGLSEEKLEAFTQMAHKLANERLPEAPFHAGAYAALETLKNHGKNIAIFSTMDRPMFEPAMQHRNLYAITKVAVAGTDVPERKPHPDGILKALRDLGMSEADKKDAVYIGDKDSDILAAHNAGIDSILFYPAAHQLFYDLEKLKAHNPTHIISDWSELIAPLA